MSIHLLLGGNMFILVAYDVDTTTSSGAKRLRKVAKICEKNGVRVQNSVFEVLLDEANLVVFKHELSKVIDEELDSVRLYRLGNSYKNKIETLGKSALIEVGEPLLL